MLKYERETIINYNQEEDTASVYTHSTALINRLEKLTDKGCVKIKYGEGFAEYEVPKKWVKIRPPREMSEEQRAAASERAKSNFHGNRG